MNTQIKATVVKRWNITISLFLLCFSSLIAQDSTSLSIAFPWAQNGQLGVITEQGIFTAQDIDKIPYPSAKPSPSPWQKYNELGMWGFKHQNGKEIISAGYETVGEFVDGIAWVKMDHRRYFYLNEQGNVLVNFTFDKCFDASDARARVYDMNKGNKGYGYLDLKGTTIIPLQYQNAMDFIEGHALVQDWDGCWWLINSSGDKISPCSNGLVEQNGFFHVK